MSALSFVLQGFTKKAFLHPVSVTETLTALVYITQACPLSALKQRLPYNLGDSEHEFHRLYFLCHAHAKHEGEFIVSSVVYLKLSLSRITV